MKSGSTSAVERIAGPLKDKLQIFRQEYDEKNPNSCIAELASRFYLRQVPNEILDRCHFVKSLSTETRRVFVFPFVIPAQKLTFSGHLYEPVAIRDVSLLIENGDVHESSIGLLKKMDLNLLYNEAFKMTPSNI